MLNEVRRYGNILTSDPNSSDRLGRAAAVGNDSGPLNRRKPLRNAAAGLMTLVTVAVVVFSSGAQIGGFEYTLATESGAAMLAERDFKLKAAVPDSDEDLQRIQKAVMQRAETGDVQAAAFGFDLAARQRAAGKRPATKAAGEAAPPESSAAPSR